MVTTLNSSAMGQSMVDQDPCGGDRSEVPSSSLAAKTSMTSMTREEFSVVYDRCFDRVYSYVARRVGDRETCERLAGEILTTNLYVMIDGGDDRRTAIRLKVSSDQRIEEERASSSSPRVSGS
jgi:hypothetical protein